MASLPSFLIRAQAEVENNSLLVVALDIGTTYSGWAFSLRQTYLQQPDKVSVFNWNMGNKIMNRTDSCILFDKDEQFVAAGFDAKKKFLDLCDCDQEDDCFYFSAMKIFLYENMNLRANSKIKARNGKEMAALKVFSSMIRFFVDHFKEQNERQYRNMRDEDIGWVITVPAIWNDKAKQFMRKAAIEAGILPHKLMIALEPEAAAVYCRHLPLETDGRFFSVFRPYTKFMVLDIGGGTFDVTVKRMCENGSLEEVQRANGGNHGGRKLTEGFWKILQNIYDENTISTFRKSNPDDEQRIEDDFDIKKNDISQTSEGFKTFVIPFTLHSLMQTKLERVDYEHSLQHTLSERNYSEKVKIEKNCRIKVHVDIFKDLFKESCDEMYKIVFEMLFEAYPVDAVLMVGGFSDSPFAYNHMRMLIEREFNEIQVLRPIPASYAVMMGAVTYGHDPSIFSQRICRFTYGIKTSTSFDEKKDSEAKLKITKEGKRYCMDRFSKLVEIGSSMSAYRFTDPKEFYPLHHNQRRATIELFVSKQHNPRYTTEHDCFRLGHLGIELTDAPRERQKIEISMIFGETELATVKAVEVESGREVKASFDFLG